MQECFLTKQEIFVRDALFLSFLKALCQVFTENVQPIFSSLSIRSVEFCPKINNINRNFSTNSDGSNFVAFATNNSRSRIQIFLYSSK